MHSLPRASALAGRKICLALAINCWMAALPAIAADAVLDQAKRLMANRDATRAFALLAPHEQQRAGDVEYDYLLGIAALDAGDPQRAVFALERVLAVSPNHLNARAEIARAYFVLGERRNAQREFNTVRAAQELPASARATVDRYLSALEPARSRLAAFIETSYGYDTNVNSATSARELNAPGLALPPGTTLSESSLKQRDSFVGIAGGVNGSFDVAEGIALIASFAANAKNNIHRDTFNTAVYDLSFGTRITHNAHSLTVAAQGQSFRLDDGRFRDSSGILGQWQWNVSDRSQVSLFTQSARLNFPTQRSRDANRAIAGFAIAHAFGGAWNPIAFASAYGGVENPRDGTVNHLGNKPLGLRLGGQVTLSQAAQLFALASTENRRYNAVDPSFLVTRHDRQYDYRLGLNYVVADRWTVTPTIGVTDNRSTIDIYAYSRTLTSVAVRRDF